MTERPFFSTQPDCVYVFDITAFMHRAAHVCYGDRIAEMPHDDPRCVQHALGMVANVLSAHSVRQMVVAVDSPLPSPRVKLYHLYKADRKPHPPVLSSGIQKFLALLEDAGAPVFEHDSYEADDIIASALLGRDFPIVIVTSDKDMWSHICGDVAVYDPMQNLWRDRADVLQKFGVEPAQLYDYAGLVGDSSDGIPGVPGIGAKTAAKLLVELKDLEGVYNPANREQLSGLLGKKALASVLEHRDVAFLSRELARPMICAECQRLTCEAPSLAAPSAQTLRTVSGAR